MNWTRGQWPLFAVGGVVLILVIVVAVELATFDTSISVTPREPAPVDNPIPQLERFRAELSPAPLEQFAEIAERPLFRANRQPYIEPEKDPEPTPQVQPQKVEPPKVTVTGVIMTPEKNVVIYRLEGEPKTQRAVEGDKIGDWTIRSVSKAGVTLERGGNDVTVDLKKFDQGQSGRRAPARPQLLPGKK